MTIVEIPLSDTDFLLVESDYDGGVVAAGRTAELAAAGASTFVGALESVRVAADIALAKLATTARQPDEISLSFSIQLAAEAGVVVAKTAAAANLTVTMRWSTPHERTDP